MYLIDGRRRWTWQRSLAAGTKSSLWSAFVLQSWKSRFHIGTICASTSDPLLGGGGCQRALADSGDPQRNTFPSQIRGFLSFFPSCFCLKHTRWHMWKASTCTPAVAFSLVKCCRPKMTHACISGCLMGAGQTLLAGEQRICAPCTHTDR